MKKQFLFVIFCLTLAASLLAQEYHAYFGNIHAHTGYSDGSKDGLAPTPQDAYKFAKKAEHFDFLGISEHNHTQAKMQYENYAKGLKQADKENKDGQFVCRYGMEYGVIKNGGHVLVYDLDSLIGWEDESYDIFCEKGDYNSLWKIIANHPGAYATLAHPEQTDFSNLIKGPYNKTADAAICGVAISTGPAFYEKTDYGSHPAKRFGGYYQQLLALGYHLGSTIDHDNHYTTYGEVAHSRTVLLAEKLDREHLTDAYRNMRFYASEDWNANVSFTINGKPMGSILSLTNEKVTIDVTVKDEDHEAVKSIKIWYGIPKSSQLAGEVTTIKDNSNAHYEDKIDKGQSFYYYVEITQADGDKIVTAPIWVSRK